MRVPRSLLLLLATLTAGCANPEPFVDRGQILLPLTVSKPVDPVIKTGRLSICYSDVTPWTEVEGLAKERCAMHGLQTYLLGTQRYQCKATSPHMAFFACFDPEMLTPNGLPINPFDPLQVAAWEQSTGKKAKPHNLMTGPNAANRAASPNGSNGAGTDGAGGTSPGTGSPAAAPSPADTVLPPAAPPPPNFTLPQGSWGDHFQQ